MPQIRKTKTYPRLMAVSAGLAATAALYFASTEPTPNTSRTEVPYETISQEVTESPAPNHIAAVAADTQPTSVFRTTTEPAQDRPIHSRELSSEVPVTRRMLAHRFDPPASPATESIGQPSEQSLILNARKRFLAGRYSRTLALLRKHRSLYRRGTLAEEREALVIRAYAALGKKEIAVLRARSFASRYPGSIHLTAIHEALR